jgi:antitoxin component of MazEF toxin-antitoxin module
VVIPPNAFQVLGLKEGDLVRVTVEKYSSLSELKTTGENKDASSSK